MSPIANSARITTVLLSFDAVRGIEGSTELKERQYTTGRRSRCAEELPADAVPLAVDLVGCRPKPPQHRLRHRQGHLALAGKGFLDASRVERRQVPQVGGAREN